MGPTLDSVALVQQNVNFLYQQQQQQHLRSRNSSGDSSTNSDLKPVFAATTPVFNPLMNAAQHAAHLLLTSAQAKEAAQDGQKATGGSRYKTEMCRSFMETGQCKYGDKCQFAHGLQEQRAMPRHPKYKTELCRTFHTTGLCPYGTRCHFIHNEDPLKLTAIMQAKQCYIQQQARHELAKKSAILVAEHNKLHSLINRVQREIAVNSIIMNNAASAPRNVLPPVQQVLPPVQQILLQQVEARKRASLGSVADSPPTSPSCGSPKMSPPPGFSALSPFDFSASNSDCDSNNSYSPPPSPDSACSSPESSPKLARAHRLPVFTRLAGHSAI